jgi:hypothetical protein
MSFSHTSETFEWCAMGSARFRTLCSKGFGACSPFQVLHRSLQKSNTPTKLRKRVHVLADEKDINGTEVEVVEIGHC